MSDVERAGPERLDVLASTFGRAFVNEPMMLWPMGLAGDVADPLTCCFRYFLEAALGLGVVWEVADGEGAAVWVGPAQADAWEATNPWDQARIGALTDDGGRRYEGFGRGSIPERRRSRCGCSTRSRCPPPARVAGSAPP